MSVSDSLSSTLFLLSATGMFWKYGVNMALFKCTLHYQCCNVYIYWSSKTACSGFCVFVCVIIIIGWLRKCQVPVCYRMLHLHLFQSTASIGTLSTGDYLYWSLSSHLPVFLWWVPSIVSIPGNTSSGIINLWHLSWNVYACVRTCVWSCVCV